MWEQSLSGLIKALRASKDDEDRVIRQALDETQREIKSTDLDLKAGAVLKLCYLDMLGSAALAASSNSFHVVECMSSPRFHIKQVGYLAAAQSFGPHTEVAMLTTNLVKKDLSSPNPATAPLLGTSSTPPPVLSLALSSLPHLLNSENATDLTPDLVTMLNHSRPAIRRRAVLVVHTLARQDALSKTKAGPTGAGGYQDDETFDGISSGPARFASSSTPSSTDRTSIWVERLRERLRDDDAGVVGATVNVVCELAIRDPEPWLEVAPELYGLLTAGNNNWMLIKIVKLFAVLTPIEPRLVKKLLPPLTNLINTTSAMSLLYECLSTIISGGLLSSSSSLDTSALAATCVDKLSTFLVDPDQNLRYISLVALARLVPSFPHLVARHYDTVLASVDDPDETIRLRALDLVEGMVDRTTLRPIVEQLMAHLAPSASFRRADAQAAASPAVAALAGAASPSGAAPALASAKYRHHLVELILGICARNTYANVPDFEWYLDTLISLAYIALSLPPSLSTDAVVSPSPSSSSPSGPSPSAAEPQSMGAKIADDLTSVCARVKAIRPYARRRLLRLLDDQTFLTNVGSDTRAQPSSQIDRVVGAAAWVCAEYGRGQEDDDVRPVMSALFSPTLSAAVSPAVLATCFHNGVKCFARWTESLRRSWEQLGNGRPDPDELEQIGKVVQAVKERVDEHRASEDVELQERAAELAGLMEYLRQGLQAFKIPDEAPAQPAKPQPSQRFGGDDDEPNPFASSDRASSVDEDTKPDDEPESIIGPPCLQVLDDLFFAYDLNPVASGAQGMIAPPAGLDLDGWVVPSIMGVEDRDTTDSREDDSVEVDEFGRRRFPDVVPPASQLASVAGEPNGKGKKKGKRRKDEGEGGTRRKGKRREEEEDPEVIARAREERLERQREDPYYISERPKTSRRKGREVDEAEPDDVDSIPIVKLDLTSSNAAPSTRARAAPPPPPPIIDIEGEMPAGHLLRPKPKPTLSGATNGSSTPASASGASRSGTPLPAVEQELTGVVPKKVVKKKRKVPKPKPADLL